MSEHPITETLVECAKAWESMGFDFEREATCNAIKEITRLREALKFYTDEKEYEERIIELPLDRDGHYATERTGKIILDRGGIARETLAGKP